jgi:hypothetical protein
MRECVVDDPVHCEPVSRPKLPVNRENYMEIREICGGAAVVFVKMCPADGYFVEMRRESEQGICEGGTAKSNARSGNSSAPSPFRLTSTFGAKRTRFNSVATSPFDPTRTSRLSGGQTGSYSVATNRSVARPFYLRRQSRTFLRRTYKVEPHSISNSYAAARKLAERHRSSSRPKNPNVRTPVPATFHVNDRRSVTGLNFQLDRWMTYDVPRCTGTNPLNQRSHGISHRKFNRRNHGNDARRGS